MDDYINREDAINEICRRGCEIERSGTLVVSMREAKQFAVNVLEEISTADVHENVRGIWNNALNFSNGNEDLECSVCGEWFFSYKIDCDWNFCPNCGADMRGEKYV